MGVITHVVHHSPCGLLWGTRARQPTAQTSTALPYWCKPLRRQIMGGKIAATTTLEAAKRKHSSGGGCGVLKKSERQQQQEELNDGGVARRSLRVMCVGLCPTTEQTQPRRSAGSEPLAGAKRQTAWAGRRGHWRLFLLRS